MIGGKKPQNQQQQPKRWYKTQKQQYKNLKVNAAVKWEVSFTR